MKLVEDYIKVLKIDSDNYKQFCEDSILKASGKWSRHQWYGYDSLTEKNNSKELFVSFPSLEYSLKWNDITSKVMKSYGSFFNQDVEVQFNSATRLNWYKPGTSMLAHSDHIRSLFDGVRKGIPILSIVYALNDQSEYEGGDFVFNNLNKVYILNFGEILVFPSIFIYNHMVTEITKGNRYTAVTFAY